MDSYIIDYYNEMPYVVNVIDKMNEELAEAQSRIKQLELQLKKEKNKSAKFNSFMKPRCIADGLCDLEAFEEDIRNKFLEWCNDLTNYEKLSYKLMKDYNEYSTTSNEDSLIKYIINKLNECTHFHNDRWCELFVLTTLEAHGVNKTYCYWGAPMFEVENLIEDLCGCDITLLSLGPFEL